MEIENLIKVLQASIAPCVLISGLGLLLLSISNRFVRPIDRIRQLCHAIKDAPPEDQNIIRERLQIYYTRCRLLRVSIALIVASIFFVSLMMVMLFTNLVFHVQLVFLIKLVFIGMLGCLVAALIFFLLDIRLTLHSIKKDVDKHLIK
ncbi:MAG: DUF2721 domain-containing protein [Candidatus Omnitrophica bacterium]|nr:DUF2721 domain-containing protein [Candidatus Omnitrophota bacterium]